MAEKCKKAIVAQVGARRFALMGGLPWLLQFCSGNGTLPAG